MNFNEKANKQQQQKNQKNINNLKSIEERKNNLAKVQNYDED